MARTKTKHRSYNKINSNTDSTLREEESSRREEPAQDIPIVPPQSENDLVSSPLNTAQEPHSPVEKSPVLNAPDRTTPTTIEPRIRNDADSEQATESPPSPFSLAQTSPIPGTSTDDTYRQPEPSTSLSGYWSKDSSSSLNWAMAGCSNDKHGSAYDYDQPSTSYDREYISHFRPHSPIFPVPDSSRDSAYYSCAKTSSYSLRDHEYMSPGSPVDLAWNSSLLGRGHENPYIGSSRSRDDISRSSPSPPVDLSWDSPIIVQPSNSRDTREEVSRFCPSPPLNLAWGNKDSSKENCHSEADDAMYRPKTPDMNKIDVDTMFSPKTEKELRTSIRNLFPNGPPPQPVRPMRRPKKGDTPYIVGCTKRPRVPSPKCLTVFKGDQYGLPEYTTEEYMCSPTKRNRRAPYGSCSISKSRFNNHSNEIADRLKAHNADTLLRRGGPVYVPRTSTVTSRSFSPLPSTSTDHETIMKNDRYFTESIGTDFKLPDDGDDDLPAIYWGSNSAYDAYSNYSKAIPLVVNKNVKEEEKADECSPTVIEDANNNKNDICGDYEYCEIEFDKFIPKEKLVHYSDEEPVNIEPEEVPRNESEEKSRKEPEIIDTIDIRDYDAPRYPQGPPPSKHVSTSSDVICIDDIDANKKAQSASTSGTDSNSSKSTNSSEAETSTTDTHTTDGAVSTSGNVPFYQLNSRNEQQDIFDYLREQMSSSPSNCNKSSDVARTNDVNLVINVPDDADTSETTSQDVEFVNEITINGVRYPFEPLRPEAVVAIDEVANGICSTIKAQRRDRKRRIREAADRVIVVNNENSEPTGNGASTLELEIVDALPQSNSPEPEAKSPKNAKNLGDCPICLDRLSTGCIASTNCGHVFCLDCIKKSLSTSGKKCPTCRKQLKGTGYHQVYL